MSERLTEETLLRGIDAVRRQRSLPTRIIISPTTLKKGQDAATAMEEAARDLDRERWRHKRGWRKLRLFKRLRLADAYIRAQKDADAMRRTFGYPR